MNRRHLITAAVGATAAAAGVGWSLRKAVPAGTDSSLWTMQFPTPEGGTLDMARFRGRPLVLNFWATWCPPCVKELPAFDRFWKAYSSQGWQVVGLAIDGPTPVRQFLAKVPVGFPIGLAGFEGTDLSRSLGNSGGALPFTVVFDRDGKPRERKLGETDFEQLAKWAQSI